MSACSTRSGSRHSTQTSEARRGHARRRATLRRPVSPDADDRSERGSRACRGTSPVAAQLNAADDIEAHQHTPSAYMAWYRPMFSRTLTRISLLRSWSFLRSTHPREPFLLQLVDHPFSISLLQELYPQTLEPWMHPISIAHRLNPSFRRVIHRCPDHHHSQPTRWNHCSQPLPAALRLRA